MSTTPDTVVVVDERRRRFPVPLVAAVATAALLGGSTFALWSASGDLTGGTVVAGDLDLSLKSSAFFDVSADRADVVQNPITSGVKITGHTVDLAKWRIVPGDKVAMVHTVDVTLEGDNMVAALSVTEKPGADLNIDGMSYSYEVYRSSGTKLVSETALGTAQSLYLAAPEAAGAVGPGVDAEAVTPVYALSGAKETLVVVVYGTFDAAQVDTLDSAKAYDALSDLTVTLTQVRDTGAVFNP